MYSKVFECLVFESLAYGVCGMQWRASSKAHVLDICDAHLCVPYTAKCIGEWAEG